VSVFEAVKARTRTDNFNKMSVRWKAPTLLERNGIIKDYFLKHNVANISAGAGVRFAFVDLCENRFASIIALF